MKASEFVRKNGWSAVTNAVKSTTAEETAAFESKDLDQILTKDGGVVGFNVRVYRIPYRDVKSLVESHELIESCGGLDSARKEAHKNCFEFNAPLLKAISEVESCL